MWHGDRPQPLRADALWFRHLGYSGLRLTTGGAQIAVDPPMPVALPTVVTWTERERICGAAGSRGPLAAPAPILSWLDRKGVALSEDNAVSLGGFVVRAKAYRPIPYATPPEAIRKTISALRNPFMAANRLCFAVRRPACAPFALTLDRGDRRVLLLGQALHRFLPPSELQGLVRWAGEADVVVAGTDYDDEVATGTMIAAFSARVRILADLTGAIRRKLGLPVRPLKVAADAAPRGTRRLGPKDTVVVP